MSHIRQVTFDVTGTLLRFRKPVVQQYVEVASTLGIVSEPDTLLNKYKASFGEVTKQHPNFGKSTGIGWYEWWHKVIMGTFRGHSKLKNDDQLGLKLSEKLINHFLTDEVWVVIEGVIPMLETLKKDKLQLGIISNFDSRLHTILKNTKLSHYFSSVLTSYEVGYLKPDIRIFQKSLNLLHIKGSQSVHVGNDRVNDYNGAKAAGIHAVLFQETSPKTVPMIINKPTQLPECIEFINSKQQQ